MVFLSMCKPLATSKVKLHGVVPLYNLDNSLSTREPTVALLYLKVQEEKRRGESKEHEGSTQKTSVIVESYFRFNVLWRCHALAPPKKTTGDAT